jgi:subtilisin family serine protease
MRFKSRLRRFAPLAVAAGLLAPLIFVSAQQQELPKNPPYPDSAESIGQTVRGDEAAAKLAPELRMLYDRFAGRSRGGGPLAFSADQLDQMFSIKPGEENPFVGVAVTVSANTRIADLKKYGAKVYWRMNDVVFADLRVRSLEDVARETYVISIAAAKAAGIPPIPKVEKPPSIELPDRGGNRPGAAKLDNEFNARGLTGKGVIIGIVDSGIDWRHGDFIRPDGTSRILYIWDQFDESFDQSKGRIGSKPPVLFEGGDAGPGTVYTNQQINAALKGGGRVNSMDYNGHGTACAGTAAGNGRATADGAAGAFTGVAPEADLIIVKAGDCDEIKPGYFLGTIWIAQMAKALKRPVVINHSLGHHLTSHTGDELDESVMNSLSGARKPGVAITVAAGNEAQFSLHASGRFGPRRHGQADTEGMNFELYVSTDRTKDITLLNGYFHREDEWGLAIQGMNGLMSLEKVFT